MMDMHWISRSFSDKIKYWNRLLNIGLSTLASSYKGTENIWMYQQTCVVQYWKIHCQEEYAFRNYEIYL